jgi:hypothetical protein
MGALLLLPLLAGCAPSGDPTKPQPKKVYRDGFSTALADVVIEADGGTIIGAYDAWLVVKADPLPAPRQDGDYQPVDCTPLLAYFRREFRLAGRIARDLQLRDCREARNARLPFENGRWLAQAPNDERLFYRVWKYR